MRETMNVHECFNRSPPLLWWIARERRWEFPNELEPPSFLFFFFISLGSPVQLVNLNDEVALFTLSPHNPPPPSFLELSASSWRGWARRGWGVDSHGGNKS